MAEEEMKLENAASDCEIICTEDAGKLEVESMQSIEQANIELNPNICPSCEITMSSEETEKVETDRMKKLEELADELSELLE